MSRKLAKVALVPVVAYVALCTFMWVKQDELLFVPDREMRDEPAISYEDVMITTDDGVRINAWYAPSIEEDALTVLHCHGNGGNISYMRNAFSRFHERGFATLAFDYRGYGKSEGARSNGDLTEEAVYRDAEAAWNWLTKEKGVDPQSIVLWGQSMGGGVCSHLATKHDARALVLESTFTSVPDVGARVYWFLPVRLLSAFSFDTRSRLASLTMPVLIAHSPEDPVVPFDLSKENYEASRSARKLFIELQGGHVGGFDVTPGAMDRATEFLRGDP